MTPKDFVENYHKKNPSPYNWPFVKEDHLALISLIEKFNIKSVFEFGTWEGYTTQLMAEHSIVENITTLDIHDEMDVEYTHQFHNKTKKENYGKFIKSNKVKQIFCDSLKYNPTKQFDMVFIDGNHDFKHIKNDTELALKMKPKLIVWHDYESPGNPDVTLYLTTLIKEGKKIFIFPNSVVAYMEVKNENI